jgi:D-glycero-alpha-D-manno-heptose-7-phosphate kinase
MLMVDPVRRLDVVRALNALDGRTVDFSFTEGGCHGWKIDDARIARGGAG